VQVEQKEVEIVAGEMLQDLLAVLCDLEPVAASRQQLAQELRVELVVLRDEHAQRTLIARHRRCPHVLAGLEVEATQGLT